MATWGEIKKVLGILNQPVPSEDRIGYDIETQCFYYSDGRVETDLERFKGVKWSDTL